LDFLGDGTLRPPQRACSEEAPLDGSRAVGDMMAGSPCEAFAAPLRACPSAGVRDGGRASGGGGQFAQARGRAEPSLTSWPPRENWCGD